MKHCEKISNLDEGSRTKGNAKDLDAIMGATKLYSGGMNPINKLAQGRHL